LDCYEQHGRVVTGEDVDAIRDRLVTDWWDTGNPDQNVMIALRRSDVADLNQRARRLMREAGALGDDELQLPGGRFCVGDRVVLRRNDRRLGVANGDRGEILAIDPIGRRVEVAIADRFAQLEPDYLDRNGASMRHGYAITGHSAQGLTCDRAFVLITDEASREWAYTALSRGRESNRLYAVAPEPHERAEYAPDDRRRRDAPRALLDALGRSEAKTLASDEEWEQPVLRRARGRDLGREL
jgi:ATP-dependent exoDNAse (exonuclease V) alpha subunit